MVHFEVVAAGEFSHCKENRGRPWSLIRFTHDGTSRFSLLRLANSEDSFAKGETWSDKELPSSEIERFNLSDISNLADIKFTQNRGLPMNLNYELRFGRWQGYQLGIVFLFDPQYVEWCINNIEDFAVLDIDQLESCGTFPGQKSYKRTYQVTNDPSLNPWVKEWKSIQEYAKAFGYSDKSFRFRDDTKQLNREKLNS